MENIIELEKEIGYKYSFKHKSLIYWPQQENQVKNNDYIDEYKEELIKLYQPPSDDEEVHFIQMNPETIQNAIGLTNQVIFEVTEKCNLSCAYCSLGDTYKNVSVERSHNMDWRTATTVLDFFIQKWNNETPKNFKKSFYIGFHGGEPLINMKLIKKIINYIETNVNELDFCYSMTTNGTLLDKHIKYLVQKNFLIHVSLDGDRKMNSYRVNNNGKEVYDDLFGNLKKLQTNYPDFFEERIAFISVENSRNTDESMISFFNKEFGKRPEIHSLSSTNIANYEKWDAIRRKKEDVKNENSNSQILSDYLKLFSGNYHTHYRSLLDNPRTIRIPTGTCIPFTYRVFITAKKDIIVCERIGFESTLGKVTNKGVELDFENIANFYNNILDKFKIQCKSCYKRESCMLCFLTNEQYFAETFICEDFYPVSHLKKCIIDSVNSLRERANSTK